MFHYYLGLAVRSLRRNVVLTTLMVAAIGVGIGASMTMLTIFRAMSGDPIPDKSAQLFVPQIDNWGPSANQNSAPLTDDTLPYMLTYIDAIGLMRAHAAPHQAAMYETGFALTPAITALKPFE